MTSQSLRRYQRGKEAIEIEEIVPVQGSQYVSSDLIRQNNQLTPESG